jgi:hypothetical protein
MSQIRSPSLARCYACRAGVEDLASQRLSLSRRRTRSPVALVRSAHGTAIVPQSRCEPINAGLIRTQRRWRPD